MTVPLALVVALADAARDIDGVSVDVPAPIVDDVDEAGLLVVWNGRRFWVAITEIHPPVRSRA